MKWTYSIKGKTTAALLLAAVFGIIMLTNLVERRRFQELERSFSSIYEDRLMAESYLFHLYENLKKKQDLLQLAEERGMSRSILDQLGAFRADRSQLVAKYTQTYLTEEEKIQFDKLKALLGRVDQLEGEISRLQLVADIPASLIHTHEDVTARAFSTLSALSDIQTTEGEALRNKSKTIIMGSVSTSHFEMAILIIVGLIIQGLIFSSRTLLAGENQRHRLN